jgi:hypothetical protein
MRPHHPLHPLHGDVHIRHRATSLLLAPADENSFTYFGSDAVERRHELARVHTQVQQINLASRLVH